jgi:hypothetical protein
MHCQPIPQPANYTAAPERTTHRGEPAQPANPELMVRWFCRQCGREVHVYQHRIHGRLIASHSPDGTRLVYPDNPTPEERLKIPAGTCANTLKPLATHAEARSA